MVVSMLIFSVFFSVNDSVISFNSKRFTVISQNDTQINLLYSGRVKDYETGNYYYHRFLIKEVNVKRTKGGTLISIKLREKRMINLQNNMIIFTKLETPFFLKLSGVHSKYVKNLLRKAGLNYTWLDSLTDRDYTIYGVFTEKTLKKELLKNGGDKKAYKVKKR